MQNDRKSILKILNLLRDEMGYDFTDNSPGMLERRIYKRVLAKKLDNYNEYYEFLLNEPGEYGELIDVLTINVSKFFRDPLCFEYIGNVLIPRLVNGKLERKENTLRIWSAGCARGEEPYSIAILLKEYLESEKISMNIDLFATDIDKKALNDVMIGEYFENNISEVKWGILNKYFTVEDNKYYISDDIKDMVNFSFYDLLDKKSYVPPESIFGNFDIVLCRNVLIYFNAETHKRIFEKLYRSLNTKGYLVLGEAELPVTDLAKAMKKEVGFCKIYRKM